MELIVIGVIWLVLSALAGVWAERKGHNGAGFVLLAVLLSPLVGLVAAAAVSDRSNGGRYLPMPSVTEAELRACPVCAEKIQRAAIMCRFCRSPVEALPSIPQAPVDPRAPMIPVERRGDNLVAMIFIAILVIVSLVAGVSQLGSSANATFNGIDYRPPR